VLADCVVCTVLQQVLFSLGIQVSRAKQHGQVAKASFRWNRKETRRIHEDDGMQETDLDEWLLPKVE
jgi:hypothetical protein